MKSPLKVDNRFGPRGGFSSVQPLLKPHLRFMVGMRRNSPTIRHKVLPSVVLSCIGVWYA